MLDLHESHKARLALANERLQRAMLEALENYHGELLTSEVELTGAVRARLRALQGESVAEGDKTEEPKQQEPSAKEQEDEIVEEEPQVEKEL